MVELNVVPTQEKSSTKKCHNLCNIHTQESLNREPQLPFFEMKALSVNYILPSRGRQRPSVLQFKRKRVGPIKSKLRQRGSHGLLYTLTYDWIISANGRFQCFWHTHTPSLKSILLLDLDRYVLLLDPDRYALSGLICLIRIDSLCTAAWSGGIQSFYDL